MESVPFRSERKPVAESHDRPGAAVTPPGLEGESSHVKNSRRFSLAGGVLAALAGGGVLAGWALGIPILTSIAPGLATMKPNTAMCFLLCGLALCFLRLPAGERRSRSLWQKRAGQILGGVVLSVGLLTLVEYMAGVNLGLDTVLFHNIMVAAGGVYPGRMSPATALGFLLLGSSLLGLESGQPFFFQGCALVSVLNGLIALAGYLYGVKALYGVSAFSSTALHSAALFFVFGLASVAARPQAGFVAEVSSENLGGVLSRRILPLALVLPILIGWIRWKAQLAGYFDTAFGLAIFALSNVAMFSTVLWVSALWLNRADAARKRTAAEVAEKVETLAQQGGELLRSREALAAQTRTLQSVLDNIADGLIATDAQGKIVLWNTAADRIMGQANAGVALAEWTRHYRIFLPDQTIPFPPEELPLARALRGREARSEMFLLFEDSSGGAWLEAAAQPMRDENEQVCGAVVAFRDITRRVLADRAIRDLNLRLEQRVMERTAELLSANREMETFSYSVSHDLRAPLRHIAGFAQILREDFAVAMPIEAQGHLKRIEDGAHNMTRLVDEMLRFSRLGRHALACQPTALNPLVTEVIAILQPETVGRQIEWRIGELAAAECDPILIKQVLQNLISNALKYSRPRAQTVIEIGEIGHEEGRAIFVRDNGVGFDMKYASKLFGVFQRLHQGEDFEGTGVGLATVARIVQKHGGRIWAEAQKDRGAIFYFTLPVVAVREKQAAAGQN